MAELSHSIEALYARRAELEPGEREATRAVREAVGLLDTGRERVVEVSQTTGEVVVNEWLKYAILLLFQLAEIEVFEVGPFQYRDKLPLKKDYESCGVRVVPGASARWGPSSAAERSSCRAMSISARASGAATMVDTWATVGSCAQIGDRVHLSGGVGIGGVLEPPNALPVVIEDDVLVGSRSILTQGARVGRGAVLGEATLLNPAIPVIEAETGRELERGVIPPYAVAVHAMRPRQFSGGEFFLPCVLILRYLKEGERHDKARLNEILRETGVST
jgi:2,3,4,5-tetrahydropyridine-2-carboxylate N-succinyltransferase